MPSQKMTELTDKMGTLLEEIKAHLSNLQPEERALLNPTLDQLLLAVSKLRRASKSGTTADESLLLKVLSDEQRLLEEERQQWRRDELSLYETQEYIDLVLSSIKDYGIFTLDLNGRISTWNDGAENIFGFTSTEAINQSGSIIFTPEDRAQGAPEQELLQALEHGYAEDERWHQRKDGSRFFASGVMRQMRDRAGKLRGFIKVARDITERKQMENAERERRILAEALRDTSMLLSSSLELDRVLEQILVGLERVIPHDTSYILLVEDGKITNIHTHGMNQEERKELETWLTGYQLDFEKTPIFRQFAGAKRPTLIADMEREREYDTLLIHNRAYLGIPIIVEEEEIGVLSLTSAIPGSFTHEHAQTLETFAYQAAIAIRNAQLYFRSQELAVLQERQQLARDLHDAVSQTLFTAGVLTETLPRQWQQNPELVPKTLSMLNQLTKGALAEMRSLLLQLRPNDLQVTPIEDLLRYLLEAIQGRQKVETSLVIEGDVSLPPDAHLAFYRIAQEALNNASKHSRATQITVALREEAGRIELRIHDNGRGFALEKVRLGLGLQIMQERAKAIEANLQVLSQPGNGTNIIMVYPYIAGQLSHSDAPTNNINN